MSNRTMALVVALILASMALAIVADTSHGHARGCNTVRCDRAARRACKENPKCVLRVTHKRWHRTADPYWGIFSAIETCERGAAGWRTDTGNGFFGGLQFAIRSWYGVGGRGNPAHATRLEQIYRAVLLMRRQGYGAWPVCRKVAGV